MRHRSNLLAAEAGLALTLGLVLAAFSVDLPAPAGPPPAPPHEPDPIRLDPLPPTRHAEPRPAPQPSSLPPVEAPDIAEALVDWVEAEPLRGAEADPVAAYPLTPPEPPDDRPEIGPPDDEVVEFLPAEQMPRLIGGIEELQRAIRYPELCRAAGVEGRVFLRFVVEKDGSVTDAEVLRGIGAGCDDAALAAVRQARFTPGLQRGRPVRVRFSLPVTFRLQ